MFSCSPIFRSLNPSALPRQAQSGSSLSALGGIAARASQRADGATASISYEPASQSVVVSGSSGDVQIASDIMNEIETGSTPVTPQ